MMRRVSSRPRLVSDADKDFVNANTCLENDSADGDDHHRGGLMNDSSCSPFHDEAAYEGYGLNYMDDNDPDELLPYPCQNVLPDGNDGVPPAPQFPSANGNASSMMMGRTAAPSLTAVPPTTSSSSATMLLSVAASTSSDNNLSDYLSCHDNENSTTTSLLPRPSSLLNLEDTFQKASFLSSEVVRGAGDTRSDGKRRGSFVMIPPGEEEGALLEDLKPASAACANDGMASAKRKRPSQKNNPIPNLASSSSYTNSQWLYHPLAAPHNGACKSMVCQPEEPTTRSFFASPIQVLPQENVVNIASYLPLSDIYNLATTCHGMRSVLVNTTCANSDIWMCRMAERFPTIFHGPSDEREEYEDPTTRSVAEGLDAQLAQMRSSPTPTYDGMELGHDNPGNESPEKTSGSSSNVNYCDVTFVDDYRLPIPGLQDDECYIGHYYEGGAATKVNLPLLTGLMPTRYPQAIDPRTFLARSHRRHPDGRYYYYHQTVFRSYDLSVDDETRSVAVVVQDSQDDMAYGSRVTASQVTVPVVQFTSIVGPGDRCIISDDPFPPNCRKISCNCGQASSADNGSATSVSLGGLSSWMKSHASRKARGGRSRGSRGSSRAVSTTSLSLSTRSGHNGYDIATRPVTPVVTHLPASNAMLPSQHSPLYRFLSSLSHHCSSAQSSIDGSRSSYHSSSRSSYYDSSDSEERAIDEGLNNYGMVVKGGILSKCKRCIGKLSGRYGNKPSDNLRPFVVPTVISGDDHRDGKGNLVVDITPRLVAYFEVTIVKEQGQQASSQLDNEAASRVHRPDHAVMRHGMHHPADQQNGLGNNDDQRHECVAIGLSTRSFLSRNKMPGWCAHSYGYHGDDGGIFHGQGEMLDQFGPPFGPGDTVGCGLEYSTRRIFFVKNGKFLGYASFNKGGGLKEKIVEEGLYPTVGIDTNCPIAVNFGERPFQFDLTQFAAGTCAEVVL